MSKEVIAQTVVTDQSSGNYNKSMDLMDSMNMKVKSNKCSQCDYATSHTGSLKTHMKIHIVDKSNKCSLCDFASSQAVDLRKHLKTHWRKVQ